VPNRDVSDQSEVFISLKLFEVTSVFSFGLLSSEQKDISIYFL